MAFDYHEDEVTEVNLYYTREKMWGKCRQISPQQYLGESADGRMKDQGFFHTPFIIVMSQNGQGPSFAGQCYNVHVRCRYGKIGKRAEMKRRREGRREDGWVLFLLSAFHYFLFPINTSISGISKQRRVNGNESGASRHALAAISVVHLVAHTSCHHE